jgi:hypothetical protein
MGFINRPVNRDAGLEMPCCPLRCENRPANRPASRETGLEMPCCPANDLLWQVWKSLHKVCGTLLLPHLWCPASPAKSLMGKEVFPFEKILPWKTGKVQSDKGIEDRVSSKI